MKLNSIVPAAIAALILASPFNARAAEKKADAAPAEKTATTAEEKKESAAKSLPFKGKVATVDAKARTFTTKTKEGKENVFTITEKTKIEKADGSAGTINDIVVDESVRRTRVKLGEAKWEVVKVTLGKKETSPKEPEKTSEKKAAVPAGKK